MSAARCCPVPGLARRLAGTFALSAAAVALVAEALVAEALVAVAVFVLHALLGAGTAIAMPIAEDNETEIAQPHHFRFDPITREQGLAHATVNAVLQDHRGFLWFGTEDGLNRYDGTTFIVYRSDPHAPESLANDQVWSLFLDREGQLWIGTAGGLSRLDLATGAIRSFRHDPLQPRSLSHDGVRVIHQDLRGVLWVGTDGGGLNRFDPASETFTRLHDEPFARNGLSHDRIRAMVEARDGALWIATHGGGLNRLDPVSGEVERFSHDPRDDSSLSSDQIACLLEDRDGVLWVGTPGHGLNRFDRATRTFERFRHNAGIAHSLLSDRVSALLENRSGTLWVGTDAGLDAWLPKRQGFVHYRHRSEDPRSLGGEKVTALYQDSGSVIWVGLEGNGLAKFNPSLGSFDHYRPGAGAAASAGPVLALAAESERVVWIGTDGGGLARLDRGTGTLTHYSHDVADPTSLSDDRVTALLLDGTGVLWVGTAEGLDRFARERGSFRRYRHDPGDTTSLAPGGVRHLFENQTGDLWLGHLDGGGLDRFERSTGRFVHYRHDPADPASLSDDRVTVLYEEAPGLLWVGTEGGGLNRLNAATGSFAAYRHQPELPTSLAGDRVLALAGDGQGALWIGTGGGGLQRWDRIDRKLGRGRFESFSEGDRLHHNSVYGIVPDEQGDLWLSTDRGLLKFDARKRRFRSYGVLDGLPGTAFSSHHRGPTGEVFLGGNDGFSGFFPARIRDNRHPPEVVLVGISKNGVPLDLGRPPAELDELKLSFRDRILGLDFAALDYTAPERNQFAYQLEGFADEWIELGRQSRVTFTGLPEGRYRLRVKASNGDGVWSRDGMTLGVKVVPPPWRAWWAYALYALVGLCAVSVVARASRRYAGEARRLEELERLELAHRLELAQQSRELDRSKEELERANQRLAEASVTDALTGLKNRQFLLSSVQQELREAADYYQSVPRHSRAAERRRHATQDFLVLMVDLDGLKPLNDAYGNRAGDGALVSVGRILERSCREIDAVIRWGGDEFLVVARRVDRTSAEVVAERIRRTVAEHRFDVGGSRHASLSCSIGFAFYPFAPQAPAMVSSEQVLTIADRALGVAKSSGRNAWVGLYATERTPELGLMELIQDQLEMAVIEGKIELRSSILDPARLVWHRA